MPTLPPSICEFLRGQWTPANRNIALLGSRGAGMTALGEILAAQGHRLFGYDQSVATASTPEVPDAIGEARNSCVTGPWEWNSAEAAKSAVCICSPAIRENDPLRQQFVQAGIPTIPLHQALDAVFADHHQICVAGTHGKSTTTAMLSWIFEQAGRHPSYFVGAKFQDSKRSGNSSKSILAHRQTNHQRPALAIIESCEFNRSFHQLSPSTVVLTGLERDHFDCFGDQQAEDDAFLQLLQKMPADGFVIYNSSCTRSSALIRHINNRSFSCFMHASKQVNRCADFGVSNFEQRVSGIQFRIQFDSQSAFAKLPVFGRHNAANAANAIAAAVCHGLSLSEAVEALASFPGIERRFENRGTFRGMQQIDDYAHHPTAIRTTLQAARKKFPKREIRVCFEPHQLMRLARLQGDFVDALALADTVYVLPVLAARESASTARCHQDSHKLIIRLRSRGTSAFFSPNLDHVVRTVDHSANPNAVLLTMGAGSTHLIHDKLTDRLRRYSVA